MTVTILDAIASAARSGASRVETLRKLRDQGATLLAVSRIFDAVKYPEGHRKVQQDRRPVQCIEQRGRAPLFEPRTANVAHVPRSASNAALNVEASRFWVSTAVTMDAAKACDGLCNVSVEPTIFARQEPFMVVKTSMIAAGSAARKRRNSKRSSSLETVDIQISMRCLHARWNKQHEQITFTAPVRQGHSSSAIGSIRRGHVMSTRVGKMSSKVDPVTGKTLLSRVHKYAVGQQKNAHGKVKREVAAWTAKSKQRETK